MEICRTRLRTLLNNRFSDPPFFFFNDTAPTEIYTLSLHDALPICLPPIRLQPLQPRTEHLRHRRKYAEGRSEEHTSELQSRENLVCRLLLEKKKINHKSEIAPSHTPIDLPLHRTTTRIKYCHRQLS